MTEEEEKRAIQEARTALQTITGGIICSPMEREFFIRGYLAGKDSKSLGGVLDSVVKSDCSTIDLFGECGPIT